MYMNKKKLVSLSVVVIMIAILSFSSLAWFSDADSVTNKFNVGGTGGDADKIFSLDVYESLDENGDGVIDKTVGFDGDTTENGKGEYTYENVVPGDMLWKKVYAHNKGMYDQWVRFKVTINNASDWQALETKYGIKLYDMLMESKTTKLVNSAKWTFAADQTVLDTVNDTVTYVFYYNEILKPNHAQNADWVYLFNYVQIPYQFNQADMALFADGQFNLVARGEAIQVDNIQANTAKEAFAIVESTQNIG